MTGSYLLDTNAYALFLQNPKPLTCSKLEQVLQSGGILPFFISEITSMEIHSVLGKYRRGSPRQIQSCQRQLVKVPSEQCQWISPGRKPLKLRLFRDLQKLINDIECKRGKVQAAIINLDSDAIAKAKYILMSYADHYNINSHDALIAGVALIEKERNGLNLTIVTSDRGFKAALNDEKIPVCDPNNL